MFKTFRLSSKKNEVRRARNRTVAVEHGPTINVVSIQPTRQPIQSACSHEATSLPTISSLPGSPESAVVSVPIIYLENCEIFSIVRLREWMKTLFVFPHGTYIRSNILHIIGDHNFYLFCVGYVDVSATDGTTLTLSKVETEMALHR